ncbi:MAG TPA: hypothetical protein VGS08_04330 [Candidatus Saccharimonadales bacterium]|nr:hypothetical protein [Candidatus Saccharimonadales bacterium]
MLDTRPNHATPYDRLIKPAKRLAVGTMLSIIANQVESTASDAPDPLYFFQTAMKDDHNIFRPKSPVHTNSYNQSAGAKCWQHTHADHPTNE